MLDTYDTAVCFTYIQYFLFYFHFLFKTKHFKSCLVYLLFYFHQSYCNATIFEHGSTYSFKFDFAFEITSCICLTSTSLSPYSWMCLSLHANKSSQIPSPREAATSGQSEVQILGRGLRPKSRSRWVPVLSMS